MDYKYKLLLKEGTIIKLSGIPYRLKADTWAEGNTNPEGKVEGIRKEEKFIVDNR